MSLTYRHILIMALWFEIQSCCQAQFHTNVITTPGGVSSFTVDGTGGNPTINLTAGVTNILRINSSGSHPVVITKTINTSDRYTNASPQNINSGSITLNTPGTGFPTTLFYMCSVHGFFGQISFTVPASPVPPPNLILSIMVGTNIVMKSTGTNTTWLLIPEYNSNLLNATWAPVPSFTNNLVNGTNTTVFDRLDPICGPNVFLRLRQQKN
jgi:hypothetical protein